VPLLATDTAGNCGSTVNGDFDHVERFGLKTTRTRRSSFGELVMAANATGELSLGKVLVADPDPHSRDLYVEMLKAQSDIVECAADGRDALAVALARPPSLVITELRLPLLDGFQLVTLLRRESATRTIPTVVATADEMTAALDRAVACGADAMLAKPFRPDDLMLAVQRALAKSALRRSTEGVISEQSTHGASSPLRIRRVKSKCVPRYMTTTPPNAPPDLCCPQCSGLLVYRRSFVGGVSAAHVEQWDYFECLTCRAEFQYRGRTRKTRRIT
jgi:CheY-like chemotaxis protein